MKLVFFAFKHRYRFKDLNNFLHSRVYGKYFLLNLGGPFKHFIAKILFKIATNFKKKGRYGQARTYYKKTLSFNPSMGRSYLAIAAMYAKSANTCGTDNFSKRAVYWLAAKEAAKASKVDPNMKKNAAKSIANFKAKAPQKSEIFSSGRAGETINIGCWIQRSITVPNL